MVFLFRSKHTYEFLASSRDTNTVRASAYIGKAVWNIFWAAIFSYHFGVIYLESNYYKKITGIIQELKSMITLLII